MNKKLSQLCLIFVILILVSSCNPANQGSTGTKAGDIHHSPLEEMFSYVPKQWIDQHPDELMGPIIYYLDFEAMSRDLNLPDVSSADSRQVKLPLITGLLTQGLPFTPENIDPTASSSFISWGWDVADVSQALYIPNHQVSIIKGSFSNSTIADALTKKNYSSTQFGEFELFADPGGTMWFAVTSNLMLIVPSRNELEVITQQRLDLASSIAEISHLRRLTSLSESPHGFMIIASGDLVAMEERLGPLPPVFGNTSDPCPRKFDWDFLIVEFRSMNAHTQMAIGYSFASEQQATDNLPIVHEALTKTPALRNLSLTWADLIELNSIKVDKNLVIATVTPASKNFMGASINTRDLYGLLPATKLNPSCSPDA